MKKINKYFKGVGEEVRRIRWPNRRELWPSVGVVVSVTVVAAIGLLLCDFISTEILRAFEIAFNGGSREEQLEQIIQVAVVQLPLQY